MSTSSPASNRHLYLDPGQYAVGDRHCRFRTLLGSCVSITLWHPGRRIGAMSHFLLPYRASRPGGAPDAPDPRYGDEALILMLDGLGARGVRAQECEAKIFGGGIMFPDVDAPKHSGIGRRNGEAARQMLDAVGIPIRSESLFGQGYRTVVFDVDSGCVWARQFHPEPAP